jgi:hypothetical protein
MPLPHSIGAWLQCGFIFVLITDIIFGAIICVLDTESSFEELGQRFCGFNTQRLIATLIYSASILTGVYLVILIIIALIALAIHASWIFLAIPAGLLLFAGFLYIVYSCIEPKIPKEDMRSNHD